MDKTRRQFLRNAAKAGAAGTLLSGSIWALGNESLALNKRKFGANDQVRIGIIGTGGRGTGLMRLIRDIEGMDIVACCDIIPFRLESAMEIAAKGAKSYTNYHKLLEHPDLDAIIISSPLYLHFEMAKACLEAGKHVYCEKTMTFTIEETQRLGKIIKESNRLFQVGYQHRYNPLYSKLKEIIHGEEFGELKHVELYWNRNGDWRRPVPDEKYERLINWRMYREYSGGLMAELSSHQLNIVNFITDKEPVKVMGFGGIDYWKDGRETYDNIHAIFEYPEGMKVSATCLTTNAQMGFQMKFYGKNATIQVVRDEGYSAFLYVEPTYLQAFEKEKKVDGVTGATENLKQGKPIVLHQAGTGHEDKEPTGKALSAFGDCVRENKQPLVGYESGSKSAYCVALANKAMQSGEVIFWKDYVKRT